VSPLSLAAKNGYSGICKELLDRVYVPKIRRILSGITGKLSDYLKKRIRQLLKKKNKPIFQAASEGSKKRPRCLIRIGAEVNATGEDGEPPLYLAAQENRAREYIRTLYTMLWTVVYMGIEVCVQGKKIDEWEVIEKTPLQGRDEKFDIVELLLLLKRTSERRCK
jgi:hypothetical protein